MKEQRSSQEILLSEMSAHYTPLLLQCSSLGSFLINCTQAKIDRKQWKSSHRFAHQMGAVL